jgi:hypothetical protein
MKYKVGDKVKYEDEVGIVLRVIKSIISNNFLYEVKSKNNEVTFYFYEEDLELIEEETTIRIDESNFDPRIIQKGKIGSFRIDDIKNVAITETKNHEDTILHLNELNTSKTRKLERLMKFIANDYEITMDLDRDLIRETLMKELKDEDLVNEIMFHVRKGK